MITPVIMSSTDLYLSHGVLSMLGCLHCAESALQVAYHTAGRQTSVKTASESVSCILTQIQQTSIVTWRSTQQHILLRPSPAAQSGVKSVTECASATF